MEKYIVMDKGNYEVYGPFDSEADAQDWCDRANYHSPMNSDKWEYHIMKVLSPTVLSAVPVQ